MGDFIEHLDKTTLEQMVNWSPMIMDSLADSKLTLQFHPEFTFIRSVPVGAVDLLRSRSWFHDLPPQMRAEPYLTALVHAGVDSKLVRKGSITISVTGGNAEVHFGRTIGREKNLEWRADGAALLGAVLKYDMGPRAVRNGIWVMVTDRDCTKIRNLWNFRYANKDRSYHTLDEAETEVCCYTRYDEHFHIFQDGNYVKSITNTKADVLHHFKDGRHVETRPVGGVVVKWTDTEKAVAKIMATTKAVVVFSILDRLVVKPDGFEKGVWVVTVRDGGMAEASNLGRNGVVTSVDEAVAEINRVRQSGMSYHVFLNGCFQRSY